MDFACDSSGFTSSRVIRWFDHKYGVVRKQHSWVKVHLMCGVKTDVVTASEIRNKDARDTKLLPSLVEKTGKNFEQIAHRNKREVKKTQDWSLRPAWLRTSSSPKSPATLEKPDGLVVVPPERVQEFLDPLPVGRI